VRFLDHRAAPIAAGIPLGIKIKNGRGKHVLREQLYPMPAGHVQTAQGGLRDSDRQLAARTAQALAEELLAAARPTAKGYFDATAVQTSWRDHLSGRRHATAALWAVLMFQA
jgi:asparagine synthase (glutamine-hydrolysing)